MIKLTTIEKVKYVYECNKCQSLYGSNCEEEFTECPTCKAPIKRFINKEKLKDGEENE